MRRNLLQVLLVSLVTFELVNGTLGPGDKKAKTKTKAAEKVKLAKESVVERSLVKKDIDVQNDIVKSHHKYCEPCATQKSFENKVLGYVTPWNSKGYDVSKTFAKKFDYISPVWLQVKRAGRKKYELAEHDIDANWMQQVRSSNGSGVSFVPRILFEKLKVEDLHALFNNEEEIEALTKMLVAKAKQFTFEGYVFEIYLQLGGHGKSHINHLIRDISKALHDNGKLLIVVIPPPLANLKPNQKHKPVFDKDDFEGIKDLVDAFSLMTYDYASHNGAIAPNAPIEWVEENVKYFTDSPKYRQKILLGLNFYGMKYALDDQNVQPEPVVGSSLVDLLKAKEAHVKLDDKSDEHMFVFEFDSSRVLIFYPTLYSIQQRLELAKRLGTGISIWELGQGLDYFYDLF